MTIDGDDLDIEDVTDLPGDARERPEAPGDEADRTGLLDTSGDDVGSMDEPSWVETEDVPEEAPAGGEEAPTEGGQDTEDDLPARTMSLEVGGNADEEEDEEDEEDEDHPSDTAEELPNHLVEPQEEEEEEIPIPEGRLEVVQGPDKGSSFSITDESVLVGRGLDCGVVVNDSSVSRKHFRLDREESGYILVDLGSGNGSIVNGGRVQTLRLTDGARIEAGTSHLVWHEVTPGRALSSSDLEDEVENATLVGELASVEIDPDFRAPRKAPQRPPAKASSAPRKHPRTDPVGRKSPGRRIDSADIRTVAWAAVAVVFLLLTFVLLDRIANLGILSAAPGEVTSAESQQAKEALAEGLDAFRQQRWYDAKARFREAMKLDPSVPGGAEAIKSVDRELDAWRALEDADKALDEDAYGEAAASLKKVPDTSWFYQEAQDLLKDLRAEAIGESMATARKLMDEGKTKEAMEALEEGLEIAPKDTDAIALREQFRSQQAGDAPSAPTKKASKGQATKKTATSQKTKSKKNRSASGRKKTSDAWSMDAKKPREPTGGSAEDRTGSGSRGLALYRAGNFAGAIDYFDGVANGSGSKRERSRAQHLATAITKFDTFWRVGREAVVSGRVEDAIDSLKKARKVDQSINSAWQSKIKRLLARQYAWKAERAYDRGDYPKAGKLARTAVGLDPSESTAAKIYSDVQGKAESWLAEARSMSASDPDRAMELLARVLSVFPRGDSRYQSAYRLLNQLGSDDED